MSVYPLKEICANAIVYYLTQSPLKMQDPSKEQGVIKIQETLRKSDFYLPQELQNALAQKVIEYGQSLELLKCFPHANLTRLNITRFPHITQSYLQAVTRVFPAIQELALNSLHLNAVKECRLENLRRFDSTCGTVDIEDLSVACPQLEEISINRGKITKIEKFSFSSLKKAQIIGSRSLHYGVGSPRSWRNFYQNPTLTSGLAFGNGLVKAIAAGAPSLKELNIQRIQVSTFYGCSFNALEEIYVDCESLEDSGLCELTHAAPQLKWMLLMSCMISRFNGCQLPLLENIVIVDCNKCSQVTMQQLARVAPCLQSIKVQGLNPSSFIDCEFPSLKKIGFLSSTSQEERELLRKVLPKVEILPPL